ncbi:MAG: acylphosphatase [SAR324 cluster bacterium]|nr:acylphosphatase [SAR324 cluster bacterium]
MIHHQITVTGIVQGVSFRYYTQLEAVRLGLLGYVKNQADGSVFIEAEGSEEAMRFFEDWCRLGSPMSQVKDVIVKKGNVKNYSDFQIHY